MSQIRSYAEAKAFAYGQSIHPSRSWYNLCQGFVRTTVNAAPYGTSALKAWQSIPKVHRHQGEPPAGSIAYFDYPAIEGEAGHSVYVVENGMCFSNDIKVRGEIDLVHYTDIVRKWGMRYLGWIDWTPSGSLNLKPAPAKPPVSLARVDLSDVQKAARLDPSRRTGAVTPQSKADVILVERALVDLRLLQQKYADGSYGTKTVEAYAKYQRQLGFSGKDANGIPGIKSMRKLGKEKRVTRKFTVVP